MSKGCAAPVCTSAFLWRWFGWPNRNCVRCRFGCQSPSSDYRCCCSLARECCLWAWQEWRCCGSCGRNVAKEMCMDLNQLIANLKSIDPSVRAAAAEQLAHLAEEARSAAASLVEAMGDTDSTVRDWAYAALESLGPPPANEAAALAKLSEDQRLDLAYWAVTLLGRLAADNGVTAT